MLQYSAEAERPLIDESSINDSDVEHPDTVYLETNEESENPSLTITTVSKK